MKRLVYVKNIRKINFLEENKVYPVRECYYWAAFEYNKKYRELVEQFELRQNYNRRYKY